MRILIDATASRPDIRLFGLSLVERLLHSIRRSPLQPEEIRILVDSRDPEVVPAHSIRDAIRWEGLGELPIRWQGGTDPLGARVLRARDEAPESEWLVLSGETVVDARLLPQMAALEGDVFFIHGEDESRGEERGAILRLSVADRSGSFASDRADEAAARSVLELSEILAARGRARPLGAGEFDSYIVTLRRDLDPYVFRVPDDAARRRVERFLFWSNYKGSTDFMTKYVWPPLVWRLVRPLARVRIHPNWVTAVSIVATLAAIPAWMQGYWATGFFLAYLMSLLDSVDGKLARLTYTYSGLGNVLDHGLDLVHPPFWYMAWAWGLSGGVPESTVFQASIWMFWLYWADRLCAPIFKARTGRSIHGYLPIDVTLRTFISRRNVNLPFFTAAVACDLLTPSAGWTFSIPVFHAIVAWQAVCVVYHVVRTVQFFHVEKGSSPV